jgi:ectoine hydroxylase
MKLTNNQIQFYCQYGYLAVDNLLDKTEIQKVKNGLAKFEELKHLPNIICEDDGTIRSIFAPDKYDDIFDKIYRDERFVEPAIQLVEDEIYLYQYKLNFKKPFSRQLWEWHQDFAYWKLDDGVPKPDMISIMIYLDDARSYQGPLTIVPGSHNFDIVEFKKKEILYNGNASLMNSLGADLKYTVNERIIEELADRFGIEVLEQKAGTAVFFHPNLFHASNSNISPYSRDTAILTYNSINNLPKDRGRRPEYLCSTDYTPIRSCKMQLT